MLFRPDMGRKVPGSSSVRFLGNQKRYGLFINAYFPEDASIDLGIKGRAVPPWHCLRDGLGPISVVSSPVCQGGFMSDEDSHARNYGIRFLIQCEGNAKDGRRMLEFDSGIVLEAVSKARKRKGDSDCK